MALTGMSMAATRRYVSERDPAKGTTDATNFILGTIDVFVMAALGDSMLAFDENGVRSIRLNAQRIELVRFGLKGWEKFKDANGNDLAFKTTTRNVLGREYTVAHDDVIAQLDLALIAELANEISKDNNLLEATAKK